MLEKLAMLSLSVDAPTTMGVEALQGDMVQLSPPLLLPALHEQKVLGDQQAQLWHSHRLHGRWLHRPA